MAEAKKTTKAKAAVKPAVKEKKAAAKKAPAKKPVVKKTATVAKSETQKTAAKPKAASANSYVYAVGRRKTASVQARLFIDSKEETIINGRTLEKYFGSASLVANVLSPLKTAGFLERGVVSLHAQGGGLRGQSDAAKLAIARALVKHDALLRPILKAAGLLTRDARKVERKKPGLKKARKSPQWAKR